MAGARRRWRPKATLGATSAALPSLGTQVRFKLGTKANRITATRPYDRKDMDDDVPALVHSSSDGGDMWPPYLLMRPTDKAPKMEHVEPDVTPYATSGALASSRDALRADLDLRAYRPS